MGYDFQTVLDCADPHVLADWWAQTLKWVVEPTDEDFIRRMIAEGYASDDDVTVYKGALVWKTATAIRHPDDPDRGPRRRMLFQLVPEAKTVKNRMHIDIWVGPDNVEDTLADIVERGGSFLHRGQEGPHTWVTVADPEGNEFCVT